MLASVFSEDEFRCEVYVDDPLMAVGGEEAQRTKLLTIGALVLAVSGFPLSWGKASVGKQVVWIGAQLAMVPKGIKVAMP